MIIYCDCLYVVVGIFIGVNYLISVGKYFWVGIVIWILVKEIKCGNFIIVGSEVICCNKGVEIGVWWCFGNCIYCCKVRWVNENRYFIIYNGIGYCVYYGFCFYFVVIIGDGVGMG